MLEILKNKSVIFFDVGYTLDYPASGDWMFTNRFYRIASERLSKNTPEEIIKAREHALEYLTEHHLVKDVEEERKQFFKYYSDISSYLDLGLSDFEIETLANDRTTNTENYIIYPDTVHVLESLYRTHKLGIISDTWPSIEKQLKTIGVYGYFSTYTYSFEHGVFKPDPKLYKDALMKCGCRTEQAVFIDDSLQNLDGAAKLGITPVWINSRHETAVDMKYTTIQSLSELIG